jgi:2-methylcitrate synthase
MELIDRYKTADEAERGIMDSLAKKEKLLGFGHPVYTVVDPRSTSSKPRRRSSRKRRADKVPLRGRPSGSRRS